MAKETLTEETIATLPAVAPGPLTTEPGHPSEQLEVENEASQEEEIEYPTGPKLWMNVASVLMVVFLHGVDLTIVAVTVPSLTNHFKTVEDIGWYSAAYGLFSSATCFFFGKMYTLFGLKKLYISGIIVFELGSLLCTLAPVSRVFILGRAVAGIGAACMNAGAGTIVPRCFPNEKRALVNGFVGLAQAIGLVGAPVLGGALIDTFTWRACFGINIPLGAVAVLMTFYGLQDPTPNSDLLLPIKEKIKRLDLVGTGLVIPSCVCFLMALQWGGIRYGWNNWRIILLFVIFALTLIAFGYVQYKQQDKAILPPRILKNRTILAGALFCGCCNGTLAVTEYYIAIYFQGVRGYTATKSGLLGIPMIVALTITGLSTAAAVTWLGYYTPFMFATSVLAPVASGLLTTLSIYDSEVKVAALLAFLGAAIGFGIQCPTTATMTVLSPKEVSIGLGIVIFSAGLGSSLFVAASATLFQERLKAEVTRYAPGTNMTAFDATGLSDIRKSIGPDRLKNVLLGYDQAVVQTLYLPLALTLLTVLGSALTEHKSIKRRKA